MLKQYSRNEMFQYRVPSLVSDRRFHSISRIIWALCALIRKLPKRRRLVWFGEPQPHLIMLVLYIIVRFLQVMYLNKLNVSIGDDCFNFFQKRRMMFNGEGSFKFVGLVMKKYFARAGFAGVE